MAKAFLPIIFLANVLDISEKEGRDAINRVSTGAMRFC